MKSRRRRVRRSRAVAFYRLLGSRRPADLQHLADHSLDRELSMLRLRLAELVSTPDIDWAEGLS